VRVHVCVCRRGCACVGCACVGGVVGVGGVFLSVCCICAMCMLYLCDVCVDTYHPFHHVFSYIVQRLLGAGEATLLDQNTFYMRTHSI